MHAPGDAPARDRHTRDDLSVTVAIVAICGASHLRRCLSALDAQTEGPPFTVVVVYDPQLDDVAAMAEERPGIPFIANEGQRTPLELAARAVREATGDLILLTEDHCIPHPDWVQRLAEAQRPERAAVGGAVEALPGGTAADWAFYLVDYFRYMLPLAAGPSPSLTVCNVAYRRDRLDEIAGLWDEIFHETAINEALKARFGDLWLEPSAAVGMRRHVRFRDALYERYAFGRLFGCTRLGFLPAWRRAYFGLLAPVLPVLLLGRMTQRSLASRRNAARFARSFPHLVALVLAWSWGEWLGYLTKRRPRSELVAPEVEDGQAR
jgi:hypothetical protein